MKKPLIVYVSGAPGSGKTTLGALLSEQLYIPQISSDLVHGGVAFSQPTHDRKQTLQSVFVPLLIDMTQKGMSVVVDQVLQRGVSETDIIDRLKPHAAIIYVHVQCSDPISRYTQRTSSSSVPSVVKRREGLLNLAIAHKKNLPRTATPLELYVPTIVVDTDSGYHPSLDTIVAFIHDNYNS